MKDFLLQGLPVITADEMVRIEKLAYEAGASDEKFMEKAGSGVAEIAEDFALSHKLKREVYLLVGKGNKGGDAFTAGAKLLENGFSVIAYHLFPLSECSPLCQKQAKRFKKDGGLIVQIKSEKELHFHSNTLIIDGLLGTGFHGIVEGVIAEVIEAANHSGVPILSIDIPSGVNGSTGEVQTMAIHATKTISLGLPKTGFFIKDGWDYVGKLVHVDFGLDPALAAQAKIEGYLIDQDRLREALPAIKRTRHKYQAGYVLAIAGSPGMSGAALMAAWSAYRAGAGIVRLFYPTGMETYGAPLELLKESWDLKNDEKILLESKRAKAFLIGPGMGRSKEVGAALAKLLQEISLPCVMDADALFFLAENPHLQLPSQTIITPHREEMQRILGKVALSHEACQDYVNKKKVTLVLKGSPTVVFYPQAKPLIIPLGDPGMATAGTGDVLTGIIGALLAQGLEPHMAACVGPALHGLAGEQCAAKKTSYGMMATDLIDELPSVFRSLFNRPLA